MRCPFKLCLDRCLTGLKLTNNKNMLHLNYLVNILYKNYCFFPHMYGEVVLSYISACCVS